MCYCCWVGLSFWLSGKGGFEGKVVEFYRLFVGKFPHEKLYVHTDREAYEVGDTVVLEGVTRKGQVCRLRKELKVEY